MSGREGGGEAESVNGGKFPALGFFIPFLGSVFGDELDPSRFGIKGPDGFLIEGELVGGTVFLIGFANGFEVLVGGNFAADQGGGGGIRRGAAGESHGGEDEEQRGGGGGQDGARESKVHRINVSSLARSSRGGAGWSKGEGDHGVVIGGTGGLDAEREGLAKILHGAGPEEAGIEIGFAEGLGDAIGEEEEAVAGAKIHGEALRLNGFVLADALGEGVMG